MKILHLGLCVQPTPINGFQKSFIDNSTEYRELNCGDKEFNAKAKQISNEFKPDLVFIQIQAAGILEPKTVDVLRNNGAYVMNWTGDVRDGVPPWMLHTGCNITLFSNMRDVNEMNARGFKSAFLEIGYDPEIYMPNGEMVPTNEIVFFGNNYGTQFPMGDYRYKMVNTLKEIYKDRFGVYGHGWRNGNGNFNHSQVEEAKAYRGSKIAINCSHYEIERYSSDRIYRILGTGIPLCLAKHYPSIELDFKDKEHLVYWHDLDELKKLIDYYLMNVEERNKIAMDGNKLARENYTFDSMIKNIIKIYNER